MRIQVLGATERSEGWLTVVERSREGDTVAGLLDGIRRYWHEDEGPCLIVLSEDDGRPVCTVWRGADVDVAITTWADGRVQRHRCTYRLDPADDCYLDTDVVELDAQGQPVVLPAVECPACHQGQPGGTVRCAACSHYLV